MVENPVDSVSLPRNRVSAAEAGQRYKRAGSLVHHPLKLGDDLLVHSFLQADPAKVVGRDLVVRFKLQGFPQLLNGHVISPRDIQHPSQIGIESDGERVEPPSFFDFSDGLVVSVKLRKGQTAKVVRCRKGATTLKDNLVELIEPMPNRAEADLLALRSDNQKPAWDDRLPCPKNPRP